MRRFEFSDSTSNKFWEVEVDGKTLNVSFGEIGTKNFATPEKAKAEMEKLIKEKTGKGYVEVGGKAVKAIKPTAKPAAGKNTSAGSVGKELSKAKKQVKVADEELQGKISASKPVQNTSGMDSALVAIIQVDFKAYEASNDSKEWIKGNFARITSWQKAADLNDPRGQVLFGLCFGLGHGVKQNYSEAFKWFRRAAEQGYASAQFYLGNLYTNGNGVKEDKKEAFKWFRLAAEQGYANAEEILVRLDEEDY